MPNISQKGYSFYYSCIDIIENCMLKFLPLFIVVISNVVKGNIK